MNDWPPFRGPETVEEIESQPLRHWLRGETVPDILVRSAAALGGGHLAYRFLAAADAPLRDLTIGELLDASASCACVFLRQGPRPVVASLLPAFPVTLPAAIGAMWAGIYLPINPFLEAEAIVRMLKSAGATMLLVEGPDGPQRVFQKLSAIRSAMPELHILQCDGEPKAAPLEAWMESAPPELPDLPNESDIAAYFHTGGTTGLPKIARLTHANLAYMSFLAGFAGGMRKEDIIPCGMPLFHVGGLIFGGLAPIAAHATILQLGPIGFRDTEMMQHFWRIVDRERASILFGPPTVALSVMESFAPPAPASVRHWVSSAAALPAATNRRFTETTGIPVKEAWGLTEASLVLTFTPPEGLSRPGSVGIRLPYCELKTVRSKGSGEIQDADSGETGLLLARSPGVFAGYIDRPGEGFVVDKSLGMEPWLNTGDLGRFDDNGYLYLSGRAKDLIVRGGHNIDPLVIEDAFNSLPEVAAAAAVGKPDLRLGELPIVFVSLLGGYEVSAADLCRRAAEKILERAARPKEVIIVSSMPLTNVGKIDKTELRRRAALQAVTQLVGPDVLVAASNTPRGEIAVRLEPEPQDAGELLEQLGLKLDIRKKR